MHFHTLAVQGVFVEDGRGDVRFVPAPSPTDREVAALLASIRRRIVRLARRRGIELEGRSEEVDCRDRLAEDSPALAGLCGASVLGRVATGERAGQAVVRIGRDPEAEWVSSSGPCHAHLDGFDLHAGVAVPAGARARLEHLIRYVLRPPIAQDALELAPDGKVVVKIRRPWHDGTRALLFEPLDFLARLASLVPKPRVNLLLYYGVLAPHARLRRRALEGTRAHGPPPASTVNPPQYEQSEQNESPTLEPAAAGHTVAPAALRDGAATSPTAAASAESGPPQSPPPESAPAPRSQSPSRAGYRWADLLARAFEIDVLACSRCGGRLRLIATIADPVVIRKILAHLGLPTSCPQPLPARPPPAGLFAYDAA